MWTVLGCADLETTDSGKTSREGDRVSVECDDTGRKWLLTCVKNEWQGAAQPPCIRGNAATSLCLRHQCIFYDSYNQSSMASSFSA